MKKLLFIMFTLSVLASCSDEPKSSIDEAKITVGKIMDKDRKLYENQINKNDYDEETEHLFIELDSLKKVLNPEERQQLDNFAKKRYDELFPNGGKN